MSTWKLSNFCDSTLVQSIADTDTTVYIDPDDAALLPTLGVGDKAKAVIYNATYREIVNITAWAVDGTLTIERAKESTTARDWSAGVKFTHTPTAEVLQAVLDATVQAVYRGTAAGTNAITVTGTGSVPTPSDGDAISFEVATTNTGAVTLSFTNGSSTIGPLDMVLQDRSALVAGDLVAGYRVTAIYDSSSGDFVLVDQGSKQFYVESINTGPIPGANLLVNGGFDAWPVATSFATPATDTETADNVVVSYDGTIGAFTISRQTFALGQTDVLGGPKYFLRWDQSGAGAASSYRKLRMRVPHVGKHELQTIIASIYAKADVSPRSVTAKLIQSFGTGGSPSADVVLATEVWVLGTTWALFDITTAVSSIAGKTLGSGNDDGLILELSLPLNTVMTIDFAMGQFEYGNVVSKRSANLPLDTFHGGTGASYSSLTTLAAAIIAVAMGSSGLAQAWDADLDAVAALSSTGIAVRTASNTWAQRSVAVPTGMGVTNPAGVAGDITLTFGTALTNYVADPLSAAELASITGAFGTAAFVADNTLCHLAGAETLTGLKRFEQATATDIVRWGNTTNTSLVAPRWTDATTFEFVPSPSGTPDAAKGLGYDVTNTRWFVDTKLLVSDQVLGVDGTAALPAYSSSNDPNTGIYFAADDTIRFSANGTLRWTMDSAARLNALSSACTILNGDNNSATLPAYSFSNDSDTGMYRVGANNIGWTVGATLRMDLTSARLLFASGIDVQINSATGPASVTSLGFRGIPNIATDKNASYTSVLSDAGAYVGYTTTATHTIPTNATVAYPIGTCITIESLNGGGTVTVHPDTGVTLRRGDGTAGTGDRSVSANSAVTIRKRSTDEWYIYGPFT